MVNRSRIKRKEQNPRKYERKVSLSKEIKENGTAAPGGHGLKKHFGQDNLQRPKKQHHEPPSITQ